MRVTRPGFIAGIKALKAKQGVADYDPNRDATRQEMRSYVCGQCHVEYYFKGPGKVVTYPWANGLKVEEIEAYYDKEGFTDWVHAETGTKVLKAQHPEFEVWSQGVHARAGVACADCHMPYERVGALEGQRPLGAQPAAEPEPRLPDLPRGAGEGAGGARAQRSRTATTRCSSARPRRRRTCWTPSWRRRRPAPPRAISGRPPRAAAEGAVAARLRGRRELDGLPRAAGDGADPGRGDRPRPPGPARGRANDEKRAMRLAAAREDVRMKSATMLVAMVISLTISESPWRPSRRW